MQQQNFTASIEVGVSPVMADAIFLTMDSAGKKGKVFDFLATVIPYVLPLDEKALRNDGYQIVKLPDGPFLVWVSIIENEKPDIGARNQNLLKALFEFVERKAGRIHGQVFWFPVGEAGKFGVPLVNRLSGIHDALTEVSENTGLTAHSGFGIPHTATETDIDQLAKTLQSAGFDLTEVNAPVPDVGEQSKPAGKMDASSVAESFAEAGTTPDGLSDDPSPLHTVQRMLVDEGYYKGPVDGVVTQDVIFSIEGYLEDNHDVDLESDGARLTLFNLFPDLPDRMISEIEAGFSSNLPVEDPDAPDTTTMTGGYHSDHPVEALENDTLGRAAIADAIAENVLHVWPDHRVRRRPMAVHLSGRWGSGKSSILNFLRHRLERDLRFVPRTAGHVDVKHQKGWVIADFNAWRLQDAGPPWWSLCNILIEAAQDSVGSSRIARRLKVRDWLWQEWKLSSPFLFLLGTILSVIAIWMVIEITQDLGSADGPQTVTTADAPDKLTTITEVRTTAADGTVTTERVVVDKTPPPPDKPVPFWQPVLGLASFIGGISALLSFLKGFNRTSSETAEALRKMRGDPDAELKNRYKRVVAEIGKPVAVFIDDLDRCRADFVVELLQGLQTAYADLPVLYVVAADRDWIVSAYNQTFEGFQPEIAKPGQPLGYLFVKKIFQLSVNVPDLAEPQAAQLTQELLGAEAEKEESSLSPELLRKLDVDAIEDAKTLEDLTTVALNIGRARRSGTVSRELFAKVREQSAQAEIKHALLGYTGLFDGNPRAIKRLVNALTFRKGYALMGGVDISFDVLARFTILDLRFPYTAAHLVQHPKKVAQSARDKPRKDAPAADAVYFHDAMIDKILEGLTEEDIIAVRAFG